MIYVRFCFFVLFFSLFSTSLYSQKIIAFDKAGKNKRVKYYKDNYIKFRTTQGVKHEGVIQEIRDSTFVVQLTEFHIRKIDRIYNTQTNQGFNTLYKVAIRGAYGYLPIVTFNRLINDDSPVVTESAIMVSGTMLGIALLSKCFYNKSYKISPKRPLKIIDLSI